MKRVHHHFFTETHIDVFIVIVLYDFPCIQGLVVLFHNTGFLYGFTQSFIHVIMQFYDDIYKRIFRFYVFYFVFSQQWFRMRRTKGARQVITYICNGFYESWSLNVKMFIFDFNR